MAAFRFANERSILNWTGRPAVAGADPWRRLELLIETSTTDDPAWREMWGVWLEIFRVAPRRDDDADSQTRVWKVRKPIHYGFFNRRARARSRARRSDAVRLLIPCLEIFSRTGSMDS